MTVPSVHRWDSHGSTHTVPGITNLSPFCCKQTHYIQDSWFHTVHIGRTATLFGGKKARKCDLRLHWCHEAGWKKSTVNCNIYNSIFMRTVWSQAHGTDCCLSHPRRSGKCNGCRLYTFPRAGRASLTRLRLPHPT